MDVTRKLHEMAMTTVEEVLHVHSDEPIYCSPAHVVKSDKDRLDFTNVSNPTRPGEEELHYQALRSYSMDHIALYDLPKWKEKEEQGSGGVHVKLWNLNENVCCLF